MDITVVAGTLGTIASTVSFVPQAFKVIRTRDTSSISTGMYAVTVFAFCCWTIYGILLQQWPLIITNSICLILSAFILVMKMLPQRQKDAVAEKLDVVSQDN